MSQSNNFSVNQENPRRELRVFIELFSLTTVFLFLTVIMFSMSDDIYLLGTAPIHVSHLHILFWVFGSFSGLATLTCVILIFYIKKAEHIGEWIETTKQYRLFGIFWSSIWVATLIVSIAGVVDNSNRIPNPIGRAVAFFGGIAILLIVCIRIISHGLKRSTKPSEEAKTSQDNSEPTPSLDLCLEEARRRLDFQFNQLDGLDNKTGIVLGTAGVIFTLLLTIIIEKPDLPHNQVIKIALAPIFLSLVLSFITISIKNYYYPPDLDRLNSHYLYLDIEKTKIEVNKVFCFDINKNKSIINRKIRLIQASYLVLGVGIGILGVWVVWFVFFNG